MCVCVHVYLWMKEREKDTVKLLITFFTLQVATEMPPEENRFTSFQQPSPLSFTEVFPYTPPPGKLPHHWGNKTPLNMLIYNIPTPDFGSLTILRKYHALAFSHLMLWSWINKLPSKMVWEYREIFRWKRPQENPLWATSHHAAAQMTNGNLGKCVFVKLQHLS